MSKKTAYYQSYDPSKLEMTEYCVSKGMCNDIAMLEKSVFRFGQEVVRFSKSLDGLGNREIASRIQAIAAKYCKGYLQTGDGISSLDEYDGLELEEEYEDED